MCVIMHWYRPTKFHFGWTLLKSLEKKVLSMWLNKYCLNVHRVMPMRNMFLEERVISHMWRDDVFTEKSNPGPYCCRRDRWPNDRCFLRTRGCTKDYILFEQLVGLDKIKLQSINLCSHPAEKRLSWDQEETQTTIAFYFGEQFFTTQAVLFSYCWYTDHLNTPKSIWKLTLLTLRRLILHLGVGQYSIMPSRAIEGHDYLIVVFFF